MGRCLQAAALTNSQPTVDRSEYGRVNAAFQDAPVKSARQRGPLTAFLAPSNMDIISTKVKFANLGRTWINLLAHVVTKGSPMAEEGLEVLGTEVSFGAQEDNDVVLERFADRQTIRNMEEVFFGRNPTVFGHSYAGLMRGPGGRNDLLDIIELLRKEPWSKRATLTLCGEANSKVPCINVVQFLVRENTVQAFYFARGQDIYRKFYADGHCIGSLAQKVAQGLGTKAGLVTGFIGSSHIYHSDMPAIRGVLQDGAEYLQPDREAESIEPSLVTKEALR